MNWGVINTTLQGVVSELTGIRLENVVFTGGFDAKAVNFDTRAILNITSVVTTGVDESRSAVATNGGDVIALRAGNRRFTLSAKVESQNQDPDQTAAAVIDRLRVRLQRSTVVQTLQAAGMAVNSFAGTAQYNTFSGGRIVTVSVMDVYMNAVENDYDTSVGSGDWIGEAIIDSETFDDAGGPISPQLHIDVDARS